MIAKRTGLIMLFGIGIFLLPMRLYSHGVASKVDPGGIAVKAEYSTGEPMSYAKVKIDAPGGEHTFQSGRTDRNGRFCFFPDVQGEWKMIVDDEMGHRLEVKVPVDETLLLQPNQQQEGVGEGSLSRFQGALIGISAIFGIFGTILGWKGYRKLKQR